MVRCVKSCNIPVDFHNGIVQSCLGTYIFTMWAMFVYSCEMLTDYRTHYYIHFRKRAGNLGDVVSYRSLYVVD